MNSRTLTIALVGNPNCGKTTVFNKITGSRQHIGNWPGKTVEKKEGRLTFNGTPIKVVDLPGIYSLRSCSEDEMIARDYILFEKPDVVLDILDATNLSRNLYLSIQMLEMGARVVLALNMFDEITARQVKIDIQELSRRLRIPVLPTAACRNEGIQDLLTAALNQSGNCPNTPLEIDYGREMEKELDELSHVIQMIPGLADRFSPRWLAIKIMEGDQYVWRVISQYKNNGYLVELRDAAVKRLEDAQSEDIASLIAGRRYELISRVLKGVTVTAAADAQRSSLSEKLDRILTHRFLGIPLFF